MRIMTGRRMITWKTLATPGFWLHHTPCSLGWCWTNNTFVARSLSPNLTTLQGYPWPLRLNYWIGFLKLGNLVLHLLSPTMFLSMQNCYTTDQCLVYSIKNGSKTHVIQTNSNSNILLVYLTNISPIHMINPDYNMMLAIAATIYQYSAY